MGSIFKIISFTKHLWKWYLYMGFFVVLTSLLSLVAPILSKDIVDIIVAKISGTNVNFSQFYFLLAAIIATDIAITFLTAFSQWIGDRLSVRLQTYLSEKFYRHVLGLNIGYYDNEITGKIVNKLYRGITSITEFIQSMLNNFLPFFLTAFVTIILLSRYSLFIAVLLAILFPIYILISHGSTLAWGKYEAQKNQLNDLSQGRVFESISGIRVVKAFAAEIHELKTFLQTRGKIEDLAISQTREWHLYDFIRRLFLNLILFAIFAYIVYWTFVGRYTIGEMTLLLQLVNQARFPLFAMSFILGQIQQAGAGSSDFFKILETRNDVVDKTGAKPLRIPKKLDLSKAFISFEDISFGYEERKKVLTGITFSIKPQEKLALVGESGQGKSTIVNLLLRYYEPQSGTIQINSQDISYVSQASLHQIIAVVFQESLLFSGTIIENIRYGKLSAKDTEIIQAAKAANAHEFIRGLPYGYKSLIGERGVKLSGGQKQRIAIARAILKNAPIIILDEATSSLDSKAEMEVQKGLKELLHNRTSIIIAHRLSTIADADHILVIAGGTVGQYGTAHELMRDKTGLYAQLVALQARLIKAPTGEPDERLKQFDIVG
ncbi:ABC transporter ATP-binding protein [Candidatus Gottesmanbacteria bacterium]|nr:ABC transporter ATP-binding protein [Candidatus Gottesmanbacteria bacterium]